MNNFSIAALGAITSFLFFILLAIFSILSNVRSIDSYLMNSTCIGCQCREVPDGN